MLGVSPTNVSSQWRQDMAQGVSDCIAQGSLVAVTHEEMVTMGVQELGALGAGQLPLEVVALELASVLVLAVGFGGSGGASEEVAGDARIAESLE